MGASENGAGELIVRACQSADPPLRPNRADQAPASPSPRAEAGPSGRTQRYDEQSVHVPPVA
jgi:hypothetical protein